MTDYIDRATRKHAGPEHARVRVYHNANRDERGRPTGYLDGYAPTDKVVHVATWHVTRRYGDEYRTDQFIQGEAWKVFNVGDDPEFGLVYEVATEYRARRNRSLSMGDVLQIDEGGWYACEDFGWKAINTPDTTCEGWYGSTYINGEPTEK